MFSSFFFGRRGRGGGRGRCSYRNEVWVSFERGDMGTGGNYIGLGFPLELSTQVRFTCSCVPVAFYKQISHGSLHTIHS